MNRVAPHVGAWIETNILSQMRCAMLSRPTWARGLKLIYSLLNVFGLPVAPHVGAWIETGVDLSTLVGGGSRPTWARGLKLLSKV